MDDRLIELPTRELIDRLATSAPVPGGGSAAALAGAMAAALVQMVVELTSGRTAAAEHEAALGRVRDAAQRCRSELLELAEVDSAAYQAVVVARRMPRGTDEERVARDARIAEATREATEAPRRIMRASERVLGLAEEMAPIGNRNAVSDVGVAGLLASAGLRGGALNVGINLPYLPEGDPIRDEAADEVARLTHGLAGREVALREAVEARLG
jgi:formiminotetrahydrofolate cyclodeaminase